MRDFQPLPPSKDDVIAACREPRWFTAAEIADVIESGRRHNSHQWQFGVLVAKKPHRREKQKATLLSLPANPV